MSRRTVVTALVGLLLVGGLGAPAVAGPLGGDDDETSLCLRTDSSSGKRDGICVVVPIGR